MQADNCQLTIAVYRPEWWCNVWRILEPIIRAGDVYALPQEMTEDDVRAYWCSPDRSVYCAFDSEVLVGTYYIRPNQMGGGSHVANGGYATAAEARGRGIARKMCEHSLVEAKRAGYRGMQFNFVVSTNVGAVHLWQSCGFEILAALPGAFLHPDAGYVDAFVMYREL